MQYSPKKIIISDARRKAMLTAAQRKSTRKARLLQLGVAFYSENVPVVHTFGQQTAKPKPIQEKNIIRTEISEKKAFATEKQHTGKILPSVSVRNVIANDPIVASPPQPRERTMQVPASRAIAKSNALDELHKRRLARQVAFSQFKSKGDRTKLIAAEKKVVTKAPIHFKKTEHSGAQADDNQYKQRIKKGFSFVSLADLDFILRKAGFSFAIVSLALLCLVGGVVYVKKGIGVKGKVLGVSDEAYSSLTSAVKSAAGQDFENSGKEFAAAYEKFSQASENIDSLGAVLVETSRFVPFASKLSSGKYTVEAAKHLTKAGQEMNEIAKNVSALDPEKNEGQKDKSFLEIVSSIRKNGEVARGELVQAKENLDKVNNDDIPEEKRDKFIQLKENLPMVIDTLGVLVDNGEILADLFGANGPRKYLFLFQNNNEMRATGGFIGSYGLLDISQGRVQNFFIDGIFNPDGQLIEKIVPPKPIQKMSAAWSLHDSNWWPDFPTSAREAIKFYEKTGGPTADGVITLTPSVMQKLLEITGPIEMSEYDVTLDSSNFVEKTQYEVEIDFDKEENAPKKILSDLAPMVLNRLLEARDAETVSRVAKAMSDAFSEKHILLYSENKKLQEMISKQGWSGETLQSQRDYVSVINTNINGYKTDGVVKERIEHSAEIQNDGSVVDTVTIIRKHEGGNSEYEWWNKVNADYMRVYVPKGSELLEVSGQTREFNEPPLDYDALGFKRDPLVEQEEKTMSVDETTGTRTYEENGKTVFANWTYVSPQETVTVTYKYRLPFKLFQITSGNGPQADAYSLVAQKQSGSVGSQFVSTVIYPQKYDLKWKSPDDISREGNVLKKETILDTDRFFGYAFERK